MLINIGVMDYDSFVLVIHITCGFRGFRVFTCRFQIQRLLDSDVALTADFFLGSMYLRDLIEKYIIKKTSLFK